MMEGFSDMAKCSKKDMKKMGRTAKGNMKPKPKAPTPMKKRKK